MVKAATHNTRTSLFFRLLIVIACFASFGAWFLAGINSVLLHIIIAGLVFLIGLFSSAYFSYNTKSIVWFILLFLAEYITTLRRNLVGTIDSLLSILPFFFVFNLKSDNKSEVLKFLLDVLGYGMLVSLIAYLIHFFGIPLPYSRITIGHYELDNYYFFLDSRNLSSSLLPISRFRFVFYEPGYTGCLIALLLYAFSFDLKKYKMLYVLVVALFFTFSLAGWLIAVFGYVLHIIKNKKKRIGWILFIAVFMVSFVVFFKTYNDGNNMVNRAILERLELGDHSDVMISGYNRSSESLRDYFWNSFVGSDYAWFGRPDYQDYFENEEIFIADWMGYVISYGWIGLILYLVFVFYPPLREKKAKYDYLALSVIFTLIFSQTIYSAFLFMYLTVLSLGYNELSKSDTNMITNIV